MTHRIFSENKDRKSRTISPSFLNSTNQKPVWKHRLETRVVHWNQSKMRLETKNEVSKQSFDIGNITHRLETNIRFSKHRFYVSNLK